jgi:hypothetical protein
MYLFKIVCFLVFTNAFLGYTQVGIGTLNPAIGTLLHIDDGSGAKGVQLPNADLIDLNTVDPLPTGTKIGTMVFNSNAFTGKGFFYWNGILWAPVQLFTNRSTKFEHAKVIEIDPAVNLNQAVATGGVDVEIMDRIVFTNNAGLFTPITDPNGRVNSVRIANDGRYRITTYLGLEQDSNFTGSTGIQARIKVTNSIGTVRYEGSYHRSTEMDQNGTGDDDGTLYFTEVIQLNTSDVIAINCTGLQGTAPVYQRDTNQSAIIIEKLR